MKKLHKTLLVAAFGGATLVGAAVLADPPQQTMDRQTATDTQSTQRSDLSAPANDARNTSPSNSTLPQDTATGGSGTTSTTTPTTDTGATANTPPASAATQDIDPQTKTLNELHHANQSEIQMARLAQANATDKKVKQFADMMVKDHTKMDKEVTDFAQKHNVTLSDTMAKSMMPAEEKQQEMSMMDKLQTLKGAQFDQTYMTGMVADHDADLQKVKTALGQVEDSQMKSLLHKALTTITKHRDVAQAWVKAHGVQARASHMMR